MPHRRGPALQLVKAITRCVPAVRRVPVLFVLNYGWSQMAGMAGVCQTGQTTLSEDVFWGVEYM